MHFSISYFEKNIFYLYTFINMSQGQLIGGGMSTLIGLIALIVGIVFVVRKPKCGDKTKDTDCDKTDPQKPFDSKKRSEFRIGGGIGIALGIILIIVGVMLIMKARQHAGGKFFF
jgi:uncharacterized membrane protein HdeD (DUF308 family)